MNETESDQQRLSQQLEADLYGVRERIGSMSAVWLALGALCLSR